MSKEMIVIKEQDLRQAIREALAECRVNHDDACYFEAVIVRRVGDYKLQPISMTPEMKLCLKNLSST